jgi:hypothetical protein
MSRIAKQIIGPVSEADYMDSLALSKIALLKSQAAMPFADKMRSLQRISLNESELPRAVSLLLGLLDQAVTDGLISKYALTGGFAVIYYSAPIHTEDADIVVVFPEAGSLLNPAPIFDYFTGKGADWHDQHLVYGGLPFQFIPGNTGLSAEALDQARKTPEGFCVVTLEHLIAMKLRAGRPKDRLHINHMLRSGAQPDQQRLLDILRRHELTEHWARFQAQEAE